MELWRSLRLYAINAFVLALLVLILIDAMPQSPSALQLSIQPIVQRMGIQQGPWNMFTPAPDNINIRAQAEVTYRDGKIARWQSPQWRQQSAWDRWIHHRRQEWCDSLISQRSEPAWRDIARYLARSLRPELPNADQGATVKVTYQEAIIEPPEMGPWTTWRQPPPFEATWTLFIEKLP